MELARGGGGASWGCQWGFPTHKRGKGREERERANMKEKKKNKPFTSLKPSTNIILKWLESIRVG
ncbi:hypothetical protein Taro_033379 [Colocasia esculenta]|uniref:Uncharacterized protein n=1 Tax=Colocasia esculenta TaxID=4460 RepID=A0A843VZZ5_COLES|nr:hypothetical protein [Colocasia esculenta]